MYRVELKDSPPNNTALSCEVPNVPCGVESIEKMDKDIQELREVPNVPCGVESFITLHKTLQFFSVPNVPCGVESYLLKFFIRKCVCS